MADPHTPPDPKLVEGLAAYTERLFELLQACARYQRSDPEAFLWNARRALEVICLLALSAHKRKVWRAGPSDGLAALQDHVKREKLADATTVHRLEMLKNHSNLGVHIRGPEKEDFTGACADFQHLLPKVVMWLFRESPLKDELLPPSSLWRVLYEIEVGGVPEVPAETAVVPDPPPAVAPDDLAASLPLPVLDPVPPPAPAAPPSRGSARRWPVALLGLVLGGLGGALLAGWAQRDAWRPLLRLAARSAPAAVAPVAAPVAARMVEVAPAPPQPTCPDGMTQIDGGKPHIGQPEPERRGWPAPRPRAIEPVDVAPFCIDSQPRSPADLRTWAGAATLADQPCDGNGDPPMDRATCIGRDEAAAYCAEVVPGGRLPRLLEWEQLSRSPQAEQVRYLDQREWIADNFPPAALNRRAAGDLSADVGIFRKGLIEKVSARGHVLHSWNQQSADNRWVNLGFRCAKDLD